MPSGHSNKTQKASGAKLRCSRCYQTTRSAGPSSTSAASTWWSTVGAERAQGDGVSAALGGEVTTEAEHVCPRGQPQAAELGNLAETKAFGDMTAGVGAGGQGGEPGGRGSAAGAGGRGVRGPLG